ncbi:hypothetical protein [Sinorhizobium medicae]|uniref:hypothetical protein n=1 Tax=Sinorhizobium medicae TaxID=110321 RepID=UPI000FD71E4D|nr:hypothetical protein [Sinorhizobium medicae]RVJ38501.1 hypothetical protein CN180_22210 [Sinorhizobium medicae]
MRYIIAAIFLFTSASFSFAQEAEMTVGPGSTVVIPGPDAPNQTDTDFGDVPDTVPETNPDTTTMTIDPVPFTQEELTPE